MGQVRICVACGHDTLPDDLFCVQCGAALLLPELEPAAVAGRPERAATAEAVPDVATPVPATELPAATALEYAGFWFRLQAIMLDGVVVAVLSLVVGLIAAVVWDSVGDVFYRRFWLNAPVVWELIGGVFYGYFWDKVPVVGQAPLFGVLGVLVVWGVGPLYCWLFTGVRGQTLGKTVLRIRVIRGEEDRPGLGGAALRELVGKLVLLILLVGPLYLLGAAVVLVLEVGFEIPVPFWLIFIAVPLGLAGFLWSIWDPRKQGWHDKIAGTYVARTARRSPR